MEPGSSVSPNTGGCTVKPESRLLSLTCGAHRKCPAAPGGGFPTLVTLTRTPPASELKPAPTPAAPALMVTTSCQPDPITVQRYANLSGCQCLILRNIGYIYGGLGSGCAVQALRPAPWASVLWGVCMSVKPCRREPSGSHWRAYASCVDVGQFPGYWRRLIDRGVTREKSNTLAAGCVSRLFRSASAEPGTAPNSAHPGPSANQGGENRPPSVIER